MPAGVPSLPTRVARALAAVPVAAGEHLLVACSGGPDSTALLAALADVAPASGWQLTAAHLDHGLRGAESRADAAAVEALAARLGVACVVRALAVGAGSNLEARARQARQRALAAIAGQVGATRILTAHTEDDQAETVLLRLVRGSGARGVGGMRPVRGRIVRPLLDVPRADVRRFLGERGLGAAIDRTNADIRHTRNRVRRLVLPFLATELNPRLAQTLAAFAARARDEDAWLDAAARARATHLRDGDALRIAVANEPLALGRRIVRAWLEHGARRGVTAAHVERVLRLARGTGRGTVGLPGPARVLREGDRLVRRAGRSAAAIPFDAAIAPAGSVEHPAGAWRLTLSAPRDRREDELATASAAHAVFDADTLPARLRVRPPRAGDRVHLPRVGTRKLKDVLIDAKVPREARPTVPVLEAGGEVLWVAGVVRASGAAVRSDTRRVVDGVLERRS